MHVERRGHEHGAIVCQEWHFRARGIKEGGGFYLRVRGCLADGKL